MPSETITSFLSTLIEDGSYYGDILWPFEEQQLAFDSLSATRQMIIEVHHHDDGDGGDNNDHDVHNNDLDGDAGDNVRDKHDDNGHNPSDLIELRLVDPTVTDNTHATINIRRVRLILQNFIFIRYDCLFVCLFNCLVGCLFVCLFAYWFVCLFLCMIVCLFFVCFIIIICFFLLRHDFIPFFC